MPDADPFCLFSLADELDEIRAGIELASELPMTADPRRVVDRHAPRLLAAVEAVLEKAGEWEAKAKKIGGQISLEDCDGAVAGFKMIGYQNHRDHAAALRETITAELAKGDGNHG